MYKMFNGIFQRKEQSKEEVKEKWNGEGGLKLSYPPDWSDIEMDLRGMIMGICTGQVCEIGCGPGRIASYLPAANYIGIDINQTAINEAQKKLPSYLFKKINWEDDYPFAQTYLLFTVLFHIPDNELSSIVSKLTNKVVIVEAMGRWLRDYGRGNNYLRDPEEYRNTFATYGFRELKFIHFSSKRYPYFINMQVFKK